MKSHCSTNHTPGHGSFPSAPAEVTAPPRLDSPENLQALAAAISSRPASTTGAPTFRYCAHVTAAGRHCRMLALVDSELCAQHDRARDKRLHKQPVADKSIADLLGNVPTFDSLASVHHFIGDIVKQFAHKRISRPDALALGYLCQLLLTSFADHRKWAARRRS